MVLNRSTQSTHSHRPPRPPQRHVQQGRVLWLVVLGLLVGGQDLERPDLTLARVGALFSEGDKILIPIHAFPVINSKKDELIPKSMDMGRACKVGQTYAKIVSIDSNCPINFEY